MLSQTSGSNNKMNYKTNFDYLQYKQTVVFQLKIQHLLFFNTCDETIIYNFHTVPSLVLSALQ